MDAHFIIQPILCGAIKIVKMETATRDTVLYGVNCTSVQAPGTSVWLVVLGIPGTPDTTRLQVYVPVDNIFQDCKLSNVLPLIKPFFAQFMLVLNTSTNTQYKKPHR